MLHAPPRRPNRFEIDLAAIAHNLGELRRIVGPSTRIIAALKADAYGFGLGEVARVIVAGGGDAVAVTDLADAASLRNYGIDCPILMYAGHLAEADCVAAAESLDLMPTILTPHSADVYSALATGPIRIFVKIDVGLERLGVAPEQAVSLVRHIRSLPNLEFHGLYTHLDVPNSAGSHAYIAWQMRRYEQVCAELEKLGWTVPVKLVASSAVLRYTRDMNLDAVDPGHVLFGLTPPGPVGVALDLRPAFGALKSKLIHTRRIDRRLFIDFSPIPTRDNMRIGIIPFGIRDGMTSLNCGSVLVRGRRVPILGSVSLEHTRIDLTDVPQACVGDEVVIVGRQADATISVEEVIAHQCITLKPELALAVRDCVERVYHG